MTLSVSTPRAQALTPRALRTAIAFCFVPCMSYAQTAPLSPPLTMPTVTVTSARFASDPALRPIGAAVIDADDIRRAGVSDVNQAVRKLGGVIGRSNLDGSPDFLLDLGGFGANSAQNMVILLDGVRMSENELSSALLSSIPIETVERIEIIRGGASVLYGEGATGGVIHVITKRPASNSSGGVLRAETGSFGLHDVRATLARSWDGFAIDAAVGDQRTDNYRDHNRFELRNFSGGAQWAYAGGRAGVRYARSRQKAEFPGSLDLAQARATPRRSNTPDDGGSLDAERASAFIEQRIGAFDLAAELSQREKTARASYFSTYQGVTSEYTSVYDSRQTQFSPRLRHLSRQFGTLNELVAGIDLTRWSRHTDAGGAAIDASQRSKALYLRDEVKFGGAGNGRVALGARRELFDKDDAGAASSQGFTAWELQGSYDVAPLVNLYAKAGRSYRVANADENGYRATAAALKGQTSRDLELGLALGDAARGLTARAFRHALVDEIFYDPTANQYGANANLDPTERKGVELDAHADLGAGWRASANLQHVSARFTSGVNAGREMVLVPRNAASARLAWAPGQGHSLDAGVQWSDSQRYGSDFDNRCAARIPSFATIDARYARQLGPWELALAGLNLADKQHFNSAFGCQGGIYPADGRQLKVSLRYDF